MTDDDDFVGDILDKTVASEELELTDLLDADIPSRKVQWVWDARIPLGALTILEGDPDCGKSTLACTLSAALTSGQALPQDIPRDPMHIGFLSGEDSAEETLSARFRIAGGDPYRMHYCAGFDDSADLFCLPTHITSFERWIIDHEFGVVFIDPLASFTDASVDSHNNVSVRRLLTPLKTIAQSTGTAIVILGHLVKQEGRKAVHAGQGSIGYAAAARSVLLASEHPSEDEECYVLASTKCNLAAKEDRPTLAYTLNKVDYQYDDGAVGSQVKLEWGDVVDLTANNITKGVPKSKLTEAKEAILEALELHPLSGEDLRSVVLAKGFSEKTFENARAALRKEGRIVCMENIDKSTVWDLAT